MKLVFLWISGAAAASSLRGEGLKSQFELWMSEFEKDYESAAEFVQRLEIWATNHAFIEKHNAKMSSYIVGHNQLSDLTQDEYAAMHKLGKYSPGIRTPKKAPVATSRRRLSELPSEIDWVESGAVPPVKNQGMCGSCWAFSAIGAIEGAHFLDTGKLVTLSEQQLVDCDQLDMGCGGGLMDNAFLFDENATGICSEEDYPYAGHRRWFRGCASEKGECTGVEHTRVSSFIDVPNTVDGLKEALTHQPVSVAIEADLQSFQFYKTGVYDDPQCGNILDHGVLAVGYGEEDGQGYFKVRNSWGATWGDAGYVKMASKSDQVNGTCGILSWASRPLLRDD